MEGEEDENLKIKREPSTEALPVSISIERGGKKRRRKKVMSCFRIMFGTKEGTKNGEEGKGSAELMRQLSGEEKKGKDVAVSYVLCPSGGKRGKKRRWRGGKGDRRFYGRALERRRREMRHFISTLH